MDNIISEIIGERINTLLAVQNKKQKELAEVLGVTDNTISYFCSGKRIPNTGQIKKIAEFFHCSTDYLFGLSDSATTDKDMQFICDVTGLSEEAIKELNECTHTNEYLDLVPDYYNLWITETIHDFREIMNSFIESGSFRKVIGLLSDYSHSMDLTADICGLHQQEIEICNNHNRVPEHEGVWYYDTFPIKEVLDNQKEIRLHYYEMQECLKAFVNQYCKGHIEKYQEAISSFNKAYREYEQLTNRTEGETHGDDQEA